MARRRRLLAVVVALVVVVAAVVVGKVVWDRAHRTDFERALGLVPAATKRFAFTDWAAVRRTLHAHPGAHPSGDTVQQLMDRAYDTDLSAASSINDSAAALQTKYGFSPATAQWEAYAQSGKGATMVLRTDDDVDFDAIARALSRLGYHKPSSDTGVWDGGADLVAAIDPTITPELQYVVLLKDRHLVVSSDSRTYAAVAGKVAQGDGDSLAGVDQVSSVAGSVAEPAAAILWARDFACADLAMSQADADAQKQAEQLVAQAGGVTPLTGLVMALAPNRDLTVAEEFATADQARRNLRPRARLAVGDSVGRGDGTFSDDFRLTSSRTAGSTVLLRLHPRDASAYVLSALYDGPVIFATC